jgi:predicted GNAT family acetyltransferase
MTAMPADTKPKRDIRIDREEGPSKGLYVIRLDGKKAEMTYSKAGETMIIIDHTEVPQALSGLGLGGLLVKRAVEDARKEGKKIVPLCPFAKAYIAKHAELQDVVKK